MCIWFIEIRGGQRTVSASFRAQNSHPSQPAVSIITPKLVRFLFGFADFWFFGLTGRAVWFTRFYETKKENTVPVSYTQIWFINCKENGVSWWNLTNLDKRTNVCNMKVLYRDLLKQMKEMNESTRRKINK